MDGKQSPIGAKVEVKELLKRTEKWSILPLYIIDGFISWEIKHGSYNAHSFNNFVQNWVIVQY